MPVALAVSLPLILAAVLIASGIAKLRHPDDLTGWRDLGVPDALRRPWLVRFHPWGEIVLGVALAVLGGALGVLAAIVAVVLMAAYTALILRARRNAPDASCACFGERTPVTGWTVARNGWLTAVAVAVAGVIWANPLWGGAVVAAIGVMWWVVALAVAAVTVLLIVRREDAAVREAPDHDEADYLRSRTPAVPVTLGDGTVATLRRLTQSSPILLLVVNDTCQSCQGVIDSVDRYRTLLPEVEVRFLLMTAPGFSRLTSAVEPQTVHDPERYVIDSLVDDLHTPTAFLFGRDGLLAGGPETGAGRIDAFVSDIYENLHGVRPGA